jgi:hypothetical protein
MATTRKTALPNRGRKVMTKSESRREAKRVAYEASLAASDNSDDDENEEEVDVVNDENAAPAGLNEDHLNTVGRCSYAAISKCIFATFAVAPPLDSCGKCGEGLHHACQTQYIFSSENMSESDGCMKRCFECVCPSTTTGALEKKKTVTIIERAVEERRIEKSNGCTDDTDDTFGVGTILEDNEYIDPLYTKKMMLFLRHHQENSIPQQTFLTRKISLRSRLCKRL